MQTKQQKDGKHESAYHLFALGYAKRKLECLDGFLAGLCFSFKRVGFLLACKT